jgi:hypothetical protein
MSRRILPWYEQAEDDEIAHSLLARTAASNSIEDSKHALKLFCGSSSAIPSFDVPARLDAIFENIGAFSGFSSCEDLAYRATLLPYFSAFMTKEQRHRTFAIARGLDGRGLKVYAGIVANRTSVSTLRACPECDRLSWERRGCRYWHRVHQLPWVTVCEFHGQPLLEVSPRFLQSSRQRLLANAEATAGEILRPISNHAPAAQAFAVASAQLLRGFPSFDSPMRRVQLYLEGCSQQGWMRGRSRVRWDFVEAALDEAVVKYLPTAVTGLEGQAAIHSFRAILQKPRTLVSPVKQLIFILATFGSIRNFIELQLARKDPSPVCLGTVHSDAFAAFASAETVTVRTTINDGQNSDGPAGALRPKRIYREMQDRIAARLARGISMQRIAAGERVSLSSVYRVLYKRPGLVDKRDASIRERTRARCRTAWLQGLNATGSTSDARRAHAATYAWLYRNDRLWLREQRVSRIGNSPRVARVDWSARDNRLAAIISTLSDIDQRYYRLLGVLKVSDATLRRNRARLPLTWAAIEALPYPKRC